jgi:hypothetical protein
LTHPSKVHVCQSAGKVIEEGFVFSLVLALRAGNRAKVAGGVRVNLLTCQKPVTLSDAVVPRSSELWIVAAPADVVVTQHAVRGFWVYVGVGEKLLRVSA